MLTRRNMLGLLGAGIAAPFVVRNSGLLMPVRQRLVPQSWVAVIKPWTGAFQYDMLAEHEIDEMLWRAAGEEFATPEELRLGYPAR